LENALEVRGKGRFECEGLARAGQAKREAGGVEEVAAKREGG
jgi:hypothetical protein